MMWARNHSRHCTQLLQALGIHDQLLAAGMIDHPWLEDASTTNNLRHPGNLSAEWRSTISEKMAAAFARQPTAFWVAKMRQAGVPFSLCRTSQAWLHAAEVEEAALSVVVDNPLQAATGIMTRYGGPGQRPELHGFASCVDYLTGYSGALGIALALLQRRRRGGGDLVLTSLAQGAQLVQAPLMWAAASQVPDARGGNAAHRRPAAGVLATDVGLLDAGARGGGSGLPRRGPTGSSPHACPSSCSTTLNCVL